MLQIPANLRGLFETLADLDDVSQMAALSDLRLPSEDHSALVCLLVADRNTTSFFDVCAADRIAQLSEDPLEPASLVGATMGPFLLVEFLGQGGSSVVFRATRQIGERAQDVALKVLHAGLFSSESRRRFRREQEILVQLSHPNIAQLIDAGVNQMGVPYIAIELVKGTDLLTFAARDALDVKGRLKLFACVCLAVDAAHKVSVVHRDLKPSNVLVTSEGVVKILDFGIAKLIDADETSTAPHNAAFTPAYAAPEQYQNRQISPSTDVYALGVLLSELLVGARLGPDATQRSGDSECRPRTSHRLDRELQLLMRTALASEPTDRYSSAGQLAGDIQRYLRSEPLAAHRPSAAYRALKFAHRHKRAMLIASLLTCGILLLLSFTLRETQVARLGEIRAHAEADRANSMRDFMFDVLTGAEPTSPGGPESVAGAADRLIKEAVASQNADPRARIELLTRMARVLDSQGKFEQARQLLTVLIPEANERFGEDDALSLDARRAGVANSILRGDVVEARRTVDELLAKSKNIGGDFSMQLLIDSSSLASKERNGQRALRESAQALELARASSVNPEVLRYALSSRGIALSKFGDDDQSLRVYTELLNLSKQSFGEHHVAVADSYLGMARAYRHKGDLNNAENYAAKALAIDQAIFVTDHPRVASDLAEVANVANEQRDFQRALTLRREVVRMARAVYGDEHPNVAAAVANVGESLSAMGDYDAATRTLRESHKLFVSNFGESHWCAATVQSNLGFSMGRSGEMQEGIAELDQSIARIGALSDPSYGLLARAYELRVLLALDAHNGQDALQFITMANDALAHESVQYWDWAGRLETLRARALIALGRSDDALQSLANASADLDRSAHPDPAVATSNLLLQASVARTLGRADEAKQFRIRGEQALASLKNPPREIAALAESAARN